MGTAAVGFIGLGSMGGGMARNLLRGGVELVVYDKDGAASAALVAAGALAADSAADVAARVGRLFLCLPQAAHVRQALFDAGGVASGATPGLHVLDASTINHADALTIGEQAVAAGMRYSDCPISGGPKGAVDGTLTIMVGDTEDEFAAAHPLLQLMGSDILHCGTLGNGQMMKAVNNVIYDINIAAFCELLPLAVKAGLDKEQVASVLTSGSSRSFASDRFVSRILDDRFDGDFAMGDAYKDIVNVQQIATRIGAATPVMAAMTAIYQLAMAQGHGGEPKSAMIKVYEDVLGVKVRRQA